MFKMFFSQFSVILRDYFSSTRNTSYNGIDINGDGASVNYTQLIKTTSAALINVINENT